MVGGPQLKTLLVLLVLVLMAVGVSNTLAWVDDTHLTGWDQVCAHPVRHALTPAQQDGLREAGLQLGLRGWSPSVAWVAEQCDALGRSHD